MLGTWVDDSVGTSGGDTSAGELRVPLDLQLRSVVEEGLPTHTTWTIKLYQVLHEKRVLAM